MAVCSCLSGKMIKKHPTLDIWCRDDGAVLLPSKGPGRKMGDWTFGCHNSDGYMVVGYKGKQYRVHNLIGETFMVKTNQSDTLDHINRIRDDNSLLNLRYASKKVQNDNRQYVIDAPNYGVRKCDDFNAYRRARYAQDADYREKCKTKAHDYYHRNKG